MDSARCGGLDEKIPPAPGTDQNELKLVVVHGGHSKESFSFNETKQ